MLFYAVIDTNVLISALLSKHENAATVQVLDKLLNGEVIPFYSNEILSEYNEVLRRKKFKFSDEVITVLLGVIEQFGIPVVPSPTDETLHDIKDVPFYEVVMEKQDENAYLVTGNIKHFPKKPFIVTVNEFLDIIKNNG